MYTQVMVVLISTNVHCLRNVVFSFQKGSNNENSSLSDSHNPIKNFLYSKILNCPDSTEFPVNPERYLVKSWIAHLKHKRISRKNRLRLKLPMSTYCVPSCWNISKKIHGVDHEMQGCIIVRQTNPKFTTYSKKGNFWETLSGSLWCS